MTQRSFVVSVGAHASSGMERGPTFAHHSVSATYITGKSVRIDGHVEGVHLAQPALLHEGRGSRRKRGEAHLDYRRRRPPATDRAAVDGNTLRPGDQVVVTGRPGRIAEDHKLLLHTIERPSDGFKWEGPNNPQ